MPLSIRPSICSAITAVALSCSVHAHAEQTAALDVKQPSRPISDPTKLEQSWLDAAREEWQVPGLSATIVHKNSAPRSLASGLCNVEARIACTPDLPFQIASMSKFFTGLVAASMVADKTVKLDAPVIEAWPQFRLSDTRWHEMTLRDLLGGRSGLGSIDWPYFWDQTLTRNDYLARLKHTPIERPFRAKFGYANANFVAAGSYLERISGKTWESLVSERIFQPFNMDSSGFSMDPSLTRGYSQQWDGQYKSIQPYTGDAIGPAGSIVSTGRDLGYWLEILVNDGRLEGRQVFPSNALSIATTPVIGTGVDRRYYGGPGSYALGAFIASYRGRIVIHHGGSYPGFSSHFAWLPSEGIAVAVLANRDGTDFSEALALALLDRELGEDSDATLSRWRSFIEPLSPQGSNPAAAPSRDITQLAGTYSNPGWGSVKIEQEGTRIVLKAGSYHTELKHVNYDSFQFAAGFNGEQMRLRFVSDFEGNISGFMLADGDNSEPQWFSMNRR